MDGFKRLASASFRNGIHSHCDSALLFGLGSYSSSIFLSIHAQEEMGKFFLIDDLYCDLKEGKKNLSEAKSFLNKKVFKDHVLKQFYFGISVGSIPQFEKLVSRPYYLKLLRNRALYVATNSKDNYIDSPSRVGTQKQALKQLRSTNSALIEMLWTGYYKQHQDLVEEDEVDNLLMENTIWANLFFIDVMPGSIDDSDKEYLEIAMRNIKILNDSSNKKRLDNSFKLYVSCRRYQSHKPVRKNINF